MRGLAAKRMRAISAAIITVLLIAVGIALVATIYFMGYRMTAGMSRASATLRIDNTQVIGGYYVVYATATLQTPKAYKVSGITVKYVDSSGSMYTAACTYNSASNAWSCGTGNAKARAVAVDGPARVPAGTSEYSVAIKSSSPVASVDVVFKLTDPATGNNVTVDTGFVTVTS